LVSAATSVFAFLTLSIGPVFSLLDAILSNGVGMCRGPVPGEKRFVVGRAGE
jgi:hypothetical protein